MNGKVLLSVIVPMRESRTGERRMVETLEHLLLSFGLAQDAAQTFLMHVGTFEHARARDRSILASMRDQASVAKNAVLGGRASSPWEIMVSLRSCRAARSATVIQEARRSDCSGSAAGSNSTVHRTPTASSFRHSYTLSRAAGAGEREAVSPTQRSGAEDWLIGTFETYRRALDSRGATA